MYCRGPNQDSSPEQQTAIRQRLAPLVRCHHLSQYWLAVSAMTAAAPELLLADLQPQLQQLLVLQAVRPGSVQERVCAHAKLQKLVPGAPSSWSGGPRALRPVDSVELHWAVDVSAIREATQHCSAQQDRVELFSPGVTPLMGPMAFQLALNVRWFHRSGRYMVGIQASPCGVPSHAQVAFTGRILAGGVTFPFRLQVPICAEEGWGKLDFFGLGAFAQGWDEVAWAAQGLPTRWAADCDRGRTCQARCMSNQVSSSLKPGAGGGGAV